MARVILRHRLLEVAVKPLGLLAACGHQRTSQHYQTSASHEPKSNLHGLHAITCRAAGGCMGIRPAAEKALLRSAFSGKNVTLS
jgi:hypothetical protein